MIMLNEYSTVVTMVIYIVSLSMYKFLSTSFIEGIQI